MNGILTNNQSENVLRAEINSNSRTLRASSFNSASLNYNNLYNKPQIESVELIGNKELEDIGVDHLGIEDLIHILD